MVSSHRFNHPSWSRLLPGLKLATLAVISSYTLFISGCASMAFSSSECSAKGGRWVNVCNSWDKYGGCSSYANVCQGITKQGLQEYERKKAEGKLREDENNKKRLLYIKRFKNSKAIKQFKQEISPAKNRTSESLAENQPELGRLAGTWCLSKRGESIYHTTLHFRMTGKNKFIVSRLEEPHTLDQFIGPKFTRYSYAARKKAMGFQFFRQEKKSKIVEIKRIRSDGVLIEHMLEYHNFPNKMPGDIFSLQGAKFGKYKNVLKWLKPCEWEFKSKNTSRDDYDD